MSFFLLLGRLYVWQLVIFFLDQFKSDFFDSPSFLNREIFFVIFHTFNWTLAVFPLPGKFAYHCHVLEHEEYAMMRPFFAVDKGVSGNVGFWSRAKFYILETDSYKTSSIYGGGGKKSENGQYNPFIILSTLRDCYHYLSSLVLA